MEEKTTRDYQMEFRNISMSLSSSLNKHEWREIYKKLTYWELELDKLGDKSVEQILADAKSRS